MQILCKLFLYNFYMTEFIYDLPKTQRYINSTVHPMKHLESGVMWYKYVTRSHLHTKLKLGATHFWFMFHNSCPLYYVGYYTM